VLVGLEQPGDDVIGRLRPATLGESGPVGIDLGRRVPLGLRPGLELRVGRPDQ